ncbi:PREDICTED: uncharacterized protein LOC105129864 isoform X2 [Populus euphratica]|uniref:Uncharacterized protein LOC105129864 isoform X2 n=1 Tax=Populus euphratica TaxID=75702 RepID=A0AAJ6UJM4_POPEU|nr:PREDICTED: uncharacterized protein LOC105129864 isoform X2 [Populus euphratica]
MKILPHSDIDNFCAPCYIYFIYFHIFHFPWRFSTLDFNLFKLDLRIFNHGKVLKVRYKERNLPIHQVRDAVADLNAQELITKKNKLRSRQKKLKACDLSSLTELLPELKPPRQSKPAAECKLNSKSRKKQILQGNG